jgi:hypothetical protein
MFSVEFHAQSFCELVLWWDATGRGNALGTAGGAGRPRITTPRNTSGLNPSCLMADSGERTVAFLIVIE